MGSPSGRYDEEPISDINIVPFVDIVLVVLIIFMVTTPYLMKHKIKINLPKSSSGEKSGSSSKDLFRVAVSKEGVISLNGRVASLSEVTLEGRRFYKKNPKVQATLAADKDTGHGKVIQLIDALKKAGIYNFNISVSKKK